VVLYVGIAAISVLILGPVIAHFELVSPMVGLVLFAGAGLIGGAVVVWGLVSWLRAKNVRSLVASMLGLPCIAALVIPVVMGMQYPRLNDVSTDLKDPPQLRGNPAYPESFKAQVEDSFPDLKPLQLPDSPAGAFTRALALAKQQKDWEITVVEQEKLRFEGVATTRLFRFKDDFTVRIRPHGTGSVLDMRSRSRVGKGDYGANSRRIRRFLELFH
jgi:uncharacterized protein (DUF1499 family)